MYYLIQHIYTCTITTQCCYLAPLVCVILVDSKRMIINVGVLPSPGEMNGVLCMAGKQCREKKCKDYYSFHDYCFIGFDNLY